MWQTERDLVQNCREGTQAAVVAFDRVAFSPWGQGVLSRVSQRFGMPRPGLRTALSFVRAHTFCTGHPRKAWFTRHARARVEIDVIN